MMADTQSTFAETFLVAIDIEKAFHAVLIEGPDGRRHPFRMANSAEDHDRLLGFLRALPGRARIAPEPTGNVHRTLAYRLLREGARSSLSSVAGARYREALFNSWDGWHGHPASAEAGDRSALPRRAPGRGSRCPGADPSLTGVRP